PLGVHGIVVGGANDHGLHVVAGILDTPGGHAGEDTSRRYFGPGQHDGTGGNHRSCSHHGVVHHDRPHADEYVVLHGATMDDRVMRYRNIASDDRSCLLVRAMNNGTVLDVGIVTDGDRIDIAPNDGVEPDRTIVPHRDIPHDHGVVGKKAIASI